MLEHELYRVGNNVIVFFTQDNTTLFGLTGYNGFGMFG